MPKVAFHTLGCKLNFSESSDLGRKFLGKGFTLVDFKETADVYVINTCTVTALAEKKCRNSIRQAIYQNPNAKVAVIGCFAQLRANEITKIEGVDYVLGNVDKHKLVDYILQETEGRFTPCIHTEVIAMTNKEEFVPSFSTGDRTRSFLKIQDGCDYFCSYCAIPFARGRNRSQTINATLKETEKIAQMRVKEVVLTGVNIGEFGTQHGENFFQLIKALEEQKAISRYRISSIEPNLLTDEMLEYIASSKSFLPHFHIPLQSGSNKILSLMKRRYDLSLFSSRIQKIKQLMPQACIAADHIVGFPGETDEDFKQICSYIESLPISYLHVFTYSERPDSYALNLPEKVPVEVRRKRSKLLQQLSEKKKLDFYKSNQNTEHQVLWESDNEDGKMLGFTENYIRVSTLFNNNLINQISQVLLTDLIDENVFNCRIL